MNAITAVAFNPYIGTGWLMPMQRKDIPLPTQDCCCHRIEVISDPDWLAPQKESIVVSMLSSSRLFQVRPPRANGACTAALKHPTTCMARCRR